MHKGHQAKIKKGAKKSSQPLPTPFLLSLMGCLQKLPDKKLIDFLRPAHRLAIDDQNRNRFGTRERDQLTFVFGVLADVLLDDLIANPQIRDAIQHALAESAFIVEVKFHLALIDFPALSQKLPRIALTLRRHGYGVPDHALFIDDHRRAVGDAFILEIDAVLPGHFSLRMKVLQQRK
jgi:hypothetical protein